MAAAISRRSALVALGVGLGAALAGCDNARAPEESTAAPGPRQPDLTADPEPTPVSAPDSAELLLALARAQHLAATSRAITGAAGWRRTAHQQVQASLDEQVQVLEELLRAGNVPVPTLSPPTTNDGDAATATGPDGAASATGDGAPTTGGGPGDRARSTGGGSATTVSPADRATAQLGDLSRSCLLDVTPEVLGALTAVSAPNLPVLIAIAGQRGATAALFGAEPDWPDLTGPTDAAAAGLLSAYHPAVYGFEVLAARSRGDERAAYERVLDPLRQATRQITALAGDAAAPPPLGYGMPEGTDSAEGRARIAGDLTATLAPTIMAATQTFTGDLDAVTGTVRLLAQAVQLARPWTPMTGFPGLQVPGA